MDKPKTSNPATTGSLSDKKKTNDTLNVPNKNPEDDSSNSSAISKTGTRGG